MFTLTRDDLRIKASSFDLTKGSNILRIICGLLPAAHPRKVH
jgi:hypothetical protein